VAITSEAVRRGWDVAVVTPLRDTDHPYFSRLRALVGESNLVFSPSWVAFPAKITALSMLRYHWQEWKSARRALLGCRRSWDFVYALNIDYMDKAIQLLGAPSRPTPMGGMTMRVRFHLNRLGVETHRSLLSSLASWSFSQLLRTRSLASVTTADPSLLSYCERQPAARYRKVFYVPEIGMEPPAVPAAEARAAFGLRADDRVILVFGFIDERKAYDELIEAICTAEVDRVRILVVGNARDSAREALDGVKYEPLRRRGILVTRLGFAEDEVQARAFAAADLVWVAYRNHSTMSGVFSQAMSCALPVIAPNYGLLSWLVSEYKVGIQVDIGNPSATGSQINALLQDQEALRTLRRNAAHLAAKHSPRNFGSAVCDAIAAGLPRR
jgi:glycosyltransferase involved in cell wall biosynthesis